MKVKRRFKNMDIFERAAGFLGLRLGTRILVSLLPLALLFVVCPRNLSARQDEQDPAQASQGQQYIQQTPEQLQQLVAPIHCIRIRSWRRSLLRRRFLSMSSRPTNGCKRVVISRATPWLKLWTNNPGTLASRRSLRSHPSLATWTKTSPGRRLSATLTTTRNKT